MKKTCYAIIIFMFIILGYFGWISYQESDSSRESSLIKLTKIIPNKYTSDMAKKNGDIVDLHGKVTNLKKLDDFIQNIKQNKKDTVRIVSYTIEGDPIIHVLNYDGKLVQYLYDNSRDKFGSTTKGIFITQAMNIEKGQKDIEIDVGKMRTFETYYLSGSLDGMEKREILLLDKSR